eukprot:9311653-Alexandrium_andersonii.AAC.1
MSASLVGSEMCIRDRSRAPPRPAVAGPQQPGRSPPGPWAPPSPEPWPAPQLQRPGRPDLRWELLRRPRRRGEA